MEMRLGDAPSVRPDEWTEIRAVAELSQKEIWTTSGPTEGAKLMAGCCNETMLLSLLGPPAGLTEGIESVGTVEVFVVQNGQPSMRQKPRHV
jgi:hypothetical protein